MGNKPNKNDNWPISKNLSLDEENQEVKPIIKFIDYKNCVVDLLHLLLRVTDQLYKLLFFKFARIDKNDGADVNLRPNLKIFLDFLKNKCKISNAFYISSKSTEKIKLRSLNGNERMRIFEELFKPYYVGSEKKDEGIIKRLNFDALFPNNLDPPENFQFENTVWFNFYKLLNQIKSFKDVSLNNNYNPVETTVEKLSVDLRTWLERYLFINEKNRNSTKITPYIHVFVFHIPEMIKIHHDINLFNTQGLEKLNDFCTQYYHFSTNKNNEKKIFKSTF